MKQGTGTAVAVEILGARISKLARRIRRMRRVLDTEAEKSVAQHRLIEELRRERDELRRQLQSSPAERLSAENTALHTEARFLADENARLKRERDALRKKLRAEEGPPGPGENGEAIPTPGTP